MKRILFLLASAVFAASLISGCKQAGPELVSTGRAVSGESLAASSEAEELAAGWEASLEAGEAATQAEADRFAARFAEENGLDAAGVRQETAEKRRFYLLDGETRQAVRCIDVTGIRLYAAGPDENMGEAAFLFTIAADMGLEPGSEPVLSVWAGGPEIIPEAALLPYEGFGLWEEVGEDG